MTISLKDAFIIARNTVRVLLDSERLEDIQEVGQITGRAAMERAVTRMAALPEGRRLLAERPELCRPYVDWSALITLPPGTVGRCLGDHLARYDLDPDKLSVPPPRADDPDYIYLLRRYRGNHDIWHAVLGLGTQGYEEVLVHAFTLGQLGFPLSVLIVFFGTLKHIVLERRWDVLRTQLRWFYELGRDCEPLLAVHWEAVWDKPLADVQRRLRLPVTAAV